MSDKPLNCVGIDPRRQHTGLHDFKLNEPAGTGEVTTKSKVPRRRYNIEYEKGVTANPYLDRHFIVDGSSKERIAESWNFIHAQQIVEALEREQEVVGAATSGVDKKAFDEAWHRAAKFPKNVSELSESVASYEATKQPTVPQWPTPLTEEERRKAEELLFDVVMSTPEGELTASKLLDSIRERFTLVRKP